MANMGTAEFTIRVDPSRVTAVTTALSLMVDLLKGYGHDWTPAQIAALDAATAALERENLLAEAI
jgi:hypothetical protein